MNGLAVTTGTIKVRSCPEIERIVQDLRALADGMDERDVTVREVGQDEGKQDVLEVEVNICGHASGSHASAIDEKVRQLGSHAVEVGTFTTEWEGLPGRFFVGNAEQVARAESATALASIQRQAPALMEADAAEALQAVIRHSTLPPLKKRYFESSCSACPFCDGRELESGPVEADGMVAWSTVECPGCGHTWQDVWTLIDMTEVHDKDGHEVPSPDEEGASQ